MKYGDYKKYILMKLGEYNGRASGMTDDDEIKEKLPFAVSEAMRFVFYGKSIKKLWHITQGEDYNMLDTQPIIKHINNDIEFSKQGAFGYYFEVDDEARVLVYENDVLVREITHKSSYPAFEAYKGLLTGGRVRIVFSGKSFYHIKNICLYSVRYSSEERIPAYSKWRAHDIPKGLYKVEKVARIKQNGEKEYVPFEIVGGKLMLQGSLSGNFLAQSAFFPALVTPETPDSEEIAVPVDTEYLIIAKACALLVQEADFREFTADVEQGMMMLENENGAEITVKKAGESRWLT